MPQVSLGGTPEAVTPTVYKSSREAVADAPHATAVFVCPIDFPVDKQYNKQEFP